MMMVNANEYRLGNLVRDKVGGEWMKIISLDDGGNIGAYVLNRERFPLPDGWQLEGIPLTPDLLMKAGFVKKGEYIPGAGHYESYNLNGFTVYGDESLKAPIRHSSRKLPLLYVHQLQNLYFALTSTDLQITLTASDKI